MQGGKRKDYTQMMDGVDSSVVSDKAGIVESPRGSRRFDMDDDTNSDWSSLHKFKTR